jgi:hypothetical protein
MAESPVAYRFPAQADSEQWRQAVTAALEGGRLCLSPLDASGARYELAGQCPRCGDDMSQSVDFSPRLLPDTFGGARIRPPDPGAVVELEVVCNCETEHRAGARGCGYGRGIRVPVRRPA